MERESFENEEVASILNTSFIPVKIDREERPDIDRIYMNFVQATTGSGGWPLNVFLTPTLEPVFGGTYFPGPNTSTPQDAFGEEQLGFVGVLHKLAEVWTQQQDRCKADAASILQQLKDFAAEGTFGDRAGLGGSSLDVELLEEAYMHYERTFDAVNGGFGGAPKFPTPAKLAFLLRLGGYPQAVVDVIGAEEVQTARAMAFTTLKAMSRGGIHDQIGNGFARYSVTADWSLPHFEKMLYDNAQLLAIYLDAFICTKDPELLGTVYDVATYLTTTLAAPKGGFYSSEDADSLYSKGDTEKREGAFYVWTARELKEILGESAPICAAFWGVKEHGNVDSENDAHDELLNKNVLRIKTTPKQLATQFGMKEADVVRVLKQGKEKLLKHRNSERIRPGLDDKVVVGWNGIAIGALARTSRVLESFDSASSKMYMEAAKKAASFVKSTMWSTSKKTLKRVWRAGATGTDAFADDYAFLIEGLIDLYEATYDESWLQWADELQATQLDLFYDHSNTTTSSSSSSGGFYATQPDAPHTILRLKDGMDTSEPSTNGVSASNLYRLASLLNDDKYKSLAAETVQAFESEMLQYPQLFGSFMCGVVAGQLGVRGTVTVVDGDATLDSVLGDVRPRGGLETRAAVRRSESGWLRGRNSLLKVLPSANGKGSITLVCDAGSCKILVEESGALAGGVAELKLGDKMA